MAFRRILIQRLAAFGILYVLISSIPTLFKEFERFRLINANMKPYMDLSVAYPKRVVFYLGGYYGTQYRVKNYILPLGIVFYIGNMILLGSTTRKTLLKKPLTPLAPHLTPVLLVTPALGP